MKEMLGKVSNQNSFF